MKSTHPPLTIAVSSCLLGHAVRYDGSHRQLEMLQTIDEATARLVPVCPEFEAGMGVPRPTVQLTGVPGNVTVREVADGNKDHTNVIRTAFEKRRRLIAGLDGYILKARSPSCAVRTAEVSSADVVYKNQPGFFVSLLIEQFPQLPLIEECDLTELEQLQVFLLRCRRYSALKS